MEEIRSVYVEKYGMVYVNRSGTCVTGKTGKPLSFSKNDDGYYFVKLSYSDHTCKNPRKDKRRLVHRLVALAFVENPNNYPEVNHIDGNKENNSADNLEWCTRRQNVKHAWETGLSKKESYKGERNGRHKLSECDIDRIWELYNDGVTRYRIAKLYKIGWTTVNHIIKGDTWTHLKK